MNLPRAFVTILLGAVLSTAPLALGQDGGGLGGGLGGKDDGKGGDAKKEKPANDEAAPLPVRVNQAIDSGVEWLKKQTLSLGNWSDQITGVAPYDPNAKGPVWCHPTGCTSLSLYTLLKCGVSREDPVIKKGFQWLKTGHANAVVGGTKIEATEIPNGTYDLAALILAIEARANPHKREAEREKELRFKLKKGEKLRTDVKLDPADQAWMAKLVSALMLRQNAGAAWRYGAMQDNKTWDNGYRLHNDLSASQLAMLAILAAERCGFVQKDEFYAGILKWTLTMQEKDGPEVNRWDPSLKKEDAHYAPQKDHARGFGYLGAGGTDPDEIATGSMTCCGLANIVICTGVLEARESKAYTPELEAGAEKAWWDGVAWLDEHWTVESNTGCHQGYHYYYLYCMERACDLKRINLLAGHPWYTDGARVLVDQQLNADTGAWTKQDTHKPCEILNTCFALLFLNRSTPAITAGD